VSLAALETLDGGSTGISVWGSDRGGGTTNISRRDSPHP